MKTDSKNATGVDTSNFAKKLDLTDLKSDADKLDINKLKNIPTNSRHLCSKLGKLDVDKLLPVPVDLNKLSDVLKNDVVKKYVYNGNIEIIEDKIPDTTNLAALNGKTNEVKDGASNITNLAATTTLTAVENKISNLSNVAQKSLKLKIKLLLNMITIYIYITTQECNKLKSENFEF